MEQQNPAQYLLRRIFIAVFGHRLHPLISYPRRAVPAIYHAGPLKAVFFYQMAHDRIVLVGVYPYMRRLGQ